MAQTVKSLPAARETQVQSLGQEDSPGEGHGYPLQYPCLENPMGRGPWRATVHGGRKESDTPEPLHFKKTEVGRVRPHAGRFSEWRPDEGCRSVEQTEGAGGSGWAGSWGGASPPLEDVEVRSKMQGLREGEEGGGRLPGPSGRGRKPTGLADL